MISGRKIPLDALRELASRHGIQTSHQDMFGHRTVASAESLLEILRVLGAPIQRFDDVPRALREQELRSWQSGLEPVTLAWDGKLREVPLRLGEAAASGRARCRILFEDGLLQEWEVQIEKLKTGARVEIGNKRHVLKKLPISVRLPAGYHHIHVECRGGGFETLVIAAPPRAYEPPGNSPLGKSWGVFLPLYSVYSKNSWGVGDFSDLERLASWVFEQGGSMASTLPLMAAFLDHPYEISPYLPASRLFWNELYIDPRRAPEFESCAAARSLVHSSFWQRDLESLRSLPRVDHRRLMALKRPVLEAMARGLVDTPSPRSNRFQEYVSRHRRLRDYARFRAATEKQKAPWPEWPQRLRKGQLQAGEYLAASERYHEYAQWLAEEQLQALAGNKTAAGAGLYLDLPLGVHPHSYDVWRERDVFALEASAGAPPDTLFTKGQKWSFPPLHPEALRRKGYSYWIESLRRQFQFASTARIDHVMGLHRLFWVPQGREPKDGVYVHYRSEELYAIVCLESHRSKTLVVGENLGTVPPEVTVEMDRRGLSPMYVLQYEAQPDPKHPLRAVPNHATASLNTHDMPPFAAFWKGSDLAELREMGLMDEEECRQRTADRRKTVDALRRFLGGSAKGSAAAPAAKILESSLQWLGRSEARMVLVNLEDLWGETAPQNVPGTSLERPNWQRKSRYALEDFTQSTRVSAILQAIGKARRQSLAKSGKPAAAGLPKRSRSKR
jgi:4-alpha-glucanotransferase